MERAVTKRVFDQAKLCQDPVFEGLQIYEKGRKIMQDVKGKKILYEQDGVLLGKHLAIIVECKKSSRKADLLDFANKIVDIQERVKNQENSLEAFFGKKILGVFASDSLGNDEGRSAEIVEEARRNHIVLYTRNGAEYSMVGSEDVGCNGESSFCNLITSTLQDSRPSD